VIFLVIDACCWFVVGILILVGNLKLMEGERIFFI